MKWLLLILSLPTDNTAARMRSWRGLKAMGAAVLRDGVYLMPSAPEHEAGLTAVAEDLRAHQGTAHLLPTEGDVEAFAPMFGRDAEFGAFMGDLNGLQSRLGDLPALESQKQVRKLRKAWEQLVGIDFFPGTAQRKAQLALEQLEAQIQRAISPGDPKPAQQAITRLSHADYQGRVWATRARPRVDRLASAWLIRRFIDPAARFVWLKSPADCPKKALGFDYDGAHFSHVGHRITFETLLASFGLETPALTRLGRLVHALDVGGALPPEAAGVECVLAGMREAISDDDQLLQISAGVFEGLLTAFQADAAPA